MRSKIRGFDGAWTHDETFDHVKRATGRTAAPAKHYARRWSTCTDGTGSGRRATRASRLWPPSRRSTRGTRTWKWWRRVWWRRRGPTPSRPRRPRPSRSTEFASSGRRPRGTSQLQYVNDSWLLVTERYQFLFLLIVDHREKFRDSLWWWLMEKSVSWSQLQNRLPSARLTLHSTKLCTKCKMFRKEIFFWY